MNGQLPSLTMSLFGIFKIAAESKKKSEEPKMDDNADPSAGIMNVSIFIDKVKTSVGGLRLGEIF